LAKKLTAKQKQTRAKKAERILKDPLVQETFELIELSVFDMLKNTEPKQEIEREYFHMLLRLSKLHIKIFKDIIKDGQKINLDTALAEQPVNLGDIKQWRQKKVAQQN